MQVRLRPVAVQRRIRPMVGRFFACPGSKTKGKTKRVENFFATCLDGGSIPPGSTKKEGDWKFLKRNLAVALFPYSNPPLPTRMPLRQIKITPAIKGVSCQANLPMDFLSRKQAAPDTSCLSLTASFPTEYKAGYQGYYGQCYHGNRPPIE